jgi:hypothetical protein
MKYSWYEEKIIFKQPPGSFKIKVVPIPVNVYLLDTAAAIRELAVMLLAQC